jgi:hypothetical protein
VRATSPLLDVGEESSFGDWRFLSPVERGRGAERSEAEWGSKNTNIFLT